MTLVAVLYSGGLDSEWLRVFNPGADLVYFNLHTAYSEWEIAGLPPQARVIDVDCRVAEIGAGAEVMNRNLYLIARLALEYKVVLIGSTADDRKWDNSPKFISLVQDALRDCELRAPLKAMTKQMIYNDLVCRTCATPIYRTCYAPVDDSPCGWCTACKLDGTILKVVPHEGWDPADFEEIKAINVEALTADGVYRRDIVDTFAHDDWITLKTSDGEIVGYGGVLRGELTDLRVRPKYQGMGFGKLLSRYRYLHFGGRTGKTLNVQTVNMWRSLGYRVEKKDDGWYYLL